MGLAAGELETVDAWWRAANYLSVGEIYLMDNPLLEKPLAPEHVKPRLLGHWGTTPGLNLIYAHANRLIRQRDVEMLWIVGPGHGGPAAVANAWLDGTWSERHSDVTRDRNGMARLFRQFSFPGGVPSHVAPEVPGSIHEGGELGYSLAHAHGAAFDNPDLVVLCVVGDGEAETGPLAASWFAPTFVNPAQDGAVLPVLHLNGYKIANPTVLARIPDDDLRCYFQGCGYEPILVAGDEPVAVHQALAEALDGAHDRIVDLQHRARSGGAVGADGAPRHRWPMIVLRTPKGWTGPAVVDGQQVEGTWRSHQVPIDRVRTDDDHRAQLEAWLRRYRPEELFDRDGTPTALVQANRPRAERRISASPHANGGLLLSDLRLPPLEDAALAVPAPGAVDGEATVQLGQWLAGVISRNPANFRLFGPDEVASNRLGRVFEVTGRAWDSATVDGDPALSPAGRVMEVLSEHLCQGWLEGYLLSGRHGLLTSYEAFVHIVDSMFNQHAKWLRTSQRLSWRAPVASLTYLLTSHVWRQDHNGFSHQDPGFLDHVANKKADVIRVYLPPDANTLLAVADQCLRSRDQVNVIVAGKQPAPQWFGLDEAVAHCARGIGVLPWASNDVGRTPDVVLGCAGDVPTLETLAAAALLRQLFSDLAVRVVNVVDLMRLQPPSAHPHGLPDSELDSLFTTDRPVIFAFHGYPALIHRLVYRRTNHGNFHVRGYNEEGTTTTPFDMVMLNGLDRYQLVIDVIDQVPGLSVSAAHTRQALVDARFAARTYARRHGVDPPDVSGWRWPEGRGTGD